MSRLEKFILAIRLSLGIPIVLILLIIFSMTNYKRYTESLEALGPNGNKINSVVSDIITSGHLSENGESSSSRIYIKYIVNGREYLHNIGDKINSNYKIGDNIEVYSNGKSNNVYIEGDSEKLYGAFKWSAIGAIPCLILTIVTFIAVNKLDEDD